MGQEHETSGDESDIDPDLGTHAGDAPPPMNGPTMKERMEGAPSWALPFATIVIQRIVIAALLGAAIVWAFDRISGLIGLVLLSFFFSLALEPGVSWLHEHRGMRRGVATGIMFGSIVLFFVLLIGLLIPLTIDLAADLSDAVPDWIDQVNDKAKDLTGSELISRNQSDDASSQLDSSIKEWFQNFGGLAVGVATTGLSLVFKLLTMGLFTFYLTANAPAVRRSLASRLPGSHQDRFLWTWNTAIRQTGGYFYSRLLLMIINGGTFFFVMVAVGTPVKYALPLSIFEGFVAEFIPAVGTYIGAAIPIVFVLAEIGLVQAVILLVWTLIYQQAENAWLSPKLSAKTMSLNAGVAFGSALAGGALFGPIGAFVALPVAGMITAFISAYATSYEVTEPAG